MDKINFTCDMAKALNSYLNSDNCRAFKIHVVEATENFLGEGWSVDVQGNKTGFSVLIINDVTEQSYCIDVGFSDFSGDLSIFGYAYGAAKIMSSAFINLFDFVNYLESGDVSKIDSIVKVMCSGFIAAEKVVA